MKNVTPKVMSLKAKINAYAKQHGIAAQVVLQNYMFECFLDRISRSPYADNFIIKGGILVSAIVGLDVRSTMDMDATLVKLPLSKEQLTTAMQEIATIPADDGISYTIISIEPIRKDDVYGGFCLRVDATYESIVTPLSIDISTGDVITPASITYTYKRLFQNDRTILLRSYPIETVLAEKLETILTRGIFNTRPRDFYDVYILTKTVAFDHATLRTALLATAEHRGTRDAIENETPHRLEILASSADLQTQWEKYQKRFPYAREISYAQAFAAVQGLLVEIVR